MSVTVGQLIEDLRALPQWAPVRMTTLVQLVQFGTEELPKASSTEISDVAYATWEGNHVLLHE